MDEECNTLGELRTLFLSEQLKWEGGKIWAGEREGTDYVQYSDGCERSRLEEFLFVSTGSEYCPRADFLKGIVLL